MVDSVATLADDVFLSKTLRVGVDLFFGSVVRQGILSWRNHVEVKGEHIALLLVEPDGDVLPVEFGKPEPVAFGGPDEHVSLTSRKLCLSSFVGGYLADIPEITIVEYLVLHFHSRDRRTAF